MSEDPFWGGPQPIRRKAAKPAVSEPDGEQWRARPGVEPHRRFPSTKALARLPQIAAGLLLAGGLALVGYASIDHGPVGGGAAGLLPAKPVVARVILQAGDRRDLRQLCADEDIPEPSCKLIVACSPPQNGPVLPGHPREIEIVLRPRTGSCGSSTAAATE